MVSSNDLRAQLEELRRDFPKFLKDRTQHLRYGMRILNVSDANPETSELFCFRKSGSTDIMGIMFHGTSSDCIESIRRNGINAGSFTSSFEYAASRSAFKDNCQNGGIVKVLAMAVLTEEANDLRREDKKLREPHYSLPLFVVTVQI